MIETKSSAGRDSCFSCLVDRRYSFKQKEEMPKKTKKAETKLTLEEHSATTLGLPAFFDTFWTSLSMEKKKNNQYLKDLFSTSLDEINVHSWTFILGFILAIF